MDDPSPGYVEPETLTAVNGIRVGHAHDLEAVTGCTVVLCPEGTQAAVDQRGGAPGTRETDALRPGRLTAHVDAVLLAGGSAFGLAAAEGVVQFLEERGRGYATSVGPVPIVPAAIVFDLAVGDSRVRPDAAMGLAACLAASDAPVEQGSVGVGTGCCVGGLHGVACATKGGVGSVAMRLPGGLVVGALFAVNALGDVLDEEGRIIAGLRAGPTSRELLDTTRVWLELPAAGTRLGGEGANTVIGVVATNARLDRAALGRVAAMAHAGIARAVRPSHTLRDGDTVFALATGSVAADVDVVGVAAGEVTSAAIRAAVRRARSLGGLPAVSEIVGRA